MIWNPCHMLFSHPGPKIQDSKFKIQNRKFQYEIQHSTWESPKLKPATGKSKIQNQLSCRRPPRDRAKSIVPMQSRVIAPATFSTWATTIPYFPVCGSYWQQ